LSDIINKIMLHDSKIDFRLPKKDKLIFTKKTKKKREKMGDVLREFIRQYISQD